MNFPVYATKILKSQHLRVSPGLVMIPEITLTLKKELYGKKAMPNNYTQISTI